MNQRDIDILLNLITKEHLKKVGQFAHDDNSQTNEQIDNLLLPGIKEQMKISIQSLNRLYEDFINQDDATIRTALEFIPLFSLYGTWLGAQLGATQEEYNTIVDFYLEKYDLIERD